MKDFRGKELKEGDVVCFFQSTSTSCGVFVEAVVVGFCNRGGYSCVKMQVGKREYVRAGHNVAKLENN